MNARGLLLACVLTTLATGPVLATEPASDSKSVGQDLASRSLTAIQRDIYAALERRRCLVGKVRMWQKSSA